MFVYGTGNIHGNHNYLRNYKILGFKTRLYHRKSYMLNYVVLLICWMQFAKNDFKKNLKVLLSEYSIVDVAAMGFPKLWYNEPLWK